MVLDRAEQIPHGQQIARVKVAVLERFRSPDAGRSDRRPRFSAEPRRPIGIRQQKGRRKIAEPHVDDTLGAENLDSEPVGLPLRVADGIERRDRTA